MTTTVRVKQSTRERAAAMARDSGVSIGEVVERSLDAYESQQFWAETKAALARHPEKPDPAWDAVDRDGLERG